jgi:hypothetical protein
MRELKDTRWQMLKKKIVNVKLVQVVRFSQIVF